MRACWRSCRRRRSGLYPWTCKAKVLGLDMQRCWTPCIKHWLCSWSYEALGCCGRVHTPLF